MRGGLVFTFHKNAHYSPHYFCFAYSLDLISFFIKKIDIFSLLPEKQVIFFNILKARTVFADKMKTFYVTL